MNKILNILAFIPCFAFAQADTTCTSSLEGKILDEHDHSALSAATIIIVELNDSTYSDKKGRYAFKDICDGVYTVRVLHFGCAPVEEKVEVKGITKRNFNPEHHAALLDKFEFIDKKPIDQTTQARNQVSEEKLNEAKGQSLGAALKSITGVNTLNTGNSIAKPVIHGLHSNRILILNNGIRQEGQQWGIEHAPEIDPFIADQLAVIKGANSVRYGSDAIAGVVLIETKPLRETAGMNGEINTVGMTNGKAGTVSAYLDGNFAKLSAFSWRLQGTLKQNGNVSAPDYFLVNTGLKEYNFSYTLGWTKKNYGIEIFYSQFNTTLGIFGASHIGNLTDLERAFNSPVPIETGGFTYEIGRPFQHIEHELVKGKFYVNTGEKSKFSIIYARQYNLRYEYDKHRPLTDSLAGIDHPELQFEITSHTADLIWEHQLSKLISGSIGMSGITQGNTYEGRALIPNFRNYSGGIFWIERLKKNRMEYEAGVRYDYKWLRIYKYEYMGNATYELISPIHEFENFSGNLGAIFRKDSTVNLSFNLGTAWRAPSVSELYSEGLHHGAAAIEYGNRILESEIAYNAIISMKYTPAKNFFLEVSPYFNYITNFIYRQPTNEPILTIRGAFPGFNYMQADAILRGCDFHLSYKISEAFEVIGKVSILRAWNKTEKNWLIMMPADRFETEITYRLKDQEKIKHTYLSLAGQYVNKQWRVPANSDFVSPPLAYFLINLNASTSFKVKKQQIEFGVSVQNLLNESYRDYLDRFRYFTDAMGRNIIFRIKVPFNVEFAQHKTHKE